MGLIADLKKLIEEHEDDSSWDSRDSYKNIWRQETKNGIYTAGGCSDWHDDLGKSDSIGEFLLKLHDLHKEIVSEIKGEYQNRIDDLKSDRSELKRLREEAEEKAHYIDFNEICREAHPNLKLDMNSYLHREKVIEALKTIQF